jgi:diamine N-acetyltransferase
VSSDDLSDRSTRRLVVLIFTTSPSSLIRHRPRLPLECRLPCGGHRLSCEQVAPSEDQKPNVQIRPAGPRDALLLARLGEETFYESFAADNEPENIAAYVLANFSPERQAAELADLNTVSFIAEVEDGHAIGYTKLKEGTPPEPVPGDRVIEIARIYSRQEWIGLGVGRALMKASLEEASRRGCEAIWLGVWDQNNRAIAFYRKWGFEVVGKQSFHMGNDEQTDLVMCRRIGEARREPAR